jgi:ATP-dependent Clp protease ATP-binding subunit ClpC
MFERYTEKARRVIFYARYEASQVGSPYIETEHLLLGVIRESHFVIDAFLGADKRVELEAKTRGWADQNKFPRTSTSVDLPISNESRRVLAYAAEEAERLSHRHIGIDHLFLGLLREENALAANLLREFGVSLESARERLRDFELPDVPRPHTINITHHRAENCMEFVNEKDQRVGISGISKAVPRQGEYVRLRRDAVLITYKVLRVTYDYYPEPPTSPHAADLLRSIRITVTPIDDNYQGGSVPIDAT